MDQRIKEKTIYEKNKEIVNTLNIPFKLHKIPEGERERKLFFWDWPIKKIEWMGRKDQTHQENFKALPRTMAKKETVDFFFFIKQNLRKQKKEEKLLRLPDGETGRMWLT